MKKFLKPAEADLVVRDPVTRDALPAEGKAVVLDSYWRRRMRDGDVVEAPAPKKAAKKADTEKKDT